MFSRLPACMRLFGNCQSRVFCDTSHVSRFFLNLQQPHLSPPQRLPPPPHHHTTAHNARRPPTTTTTTAHPNNNCRRRRCNTMSQRHVTNQNECRTSTRRDNGQREPKRAGEDGATQRWSTTTRQCHVTTRTSQDNTTTLIHTQRPSPTHKGRPPTDDTRCWKRKSHHNDETPP
ncbi:hypothetical protein K443DRAFT_10949 [Laccaria amethystina LaAM-08-1]|uniref:Unplaced genomic scaffold K443scaffold_200, whole genome shotgun sequence n=1 Tax=Laccaria amethystina LaAM-08-1 TaxID=1095629 RepID=A0A0C9WUQ5_9AGAR|nr:hypothetical protein K443DRAFT_10949 [Laccaria amethystina LaAM-08-1]